MNKSTSLVILLVAICFLHPINAESQEREGNIVDYLGKQNFKNKASAFYGKHNI